MSPKPIAIAGGTGTIGSWIVRALHNSPLYKPIILSRAKDTNKPNTSATTAIPADTDPAPNPETKETYEIETRYVDYTSVPSLTASLSGIHTVISALLIPSEKMVDYQLNLLNASIAAGVRRFAPSEFALSQEVHKQVDIDYAKIVVWDAVRAAVKRGDIDAAAFPCGMFMNYLAVGTSTDVAGERRRKRALAGFSEGALMFHPRPAPGEGGTPWVEVPLTPDGDFPDITMTDIRDIGRFVVAALGLEEPWGGRELGMAGETRNLRDIIGIMQEVLGEEVEVRTVTREELQKRLDALDQSDILPRIDVQYTMACGQGGSVIKGVLNELCPEVKPVSIREFMEEAWGK
jgi:nucleoside-diphosphate-sugar epimerase